MVLRSPQSRRVMANVKMQRYQTTFVEMENPPISYPLIYPWICPWISMDKSMNIFMDMGMDIPLDNVISMDVSMHMSVDICTHRYIQVYIHGSIL